MSRHFARGNDITFELTFYDADQQVVSPTSATLWVSYQVDGVENEDELALVSDGQGVFSATWDSSVADAGTVDWHARSSEPKIAYDGSFILVANDANPAPA